MVTIPRLEKTFIPEPMPIDTGGTQVAQAVGQLAGVVATHALREQQARATSIMNKELNKLQIELEEDRESISLEMADDPEGMADVMAERAEKRKKEILKQSTLGSGSKLTFERMIDDLFTRNTINNRKQEKQASILAFSNNLEMASADNELLAFRNGEQLNTDILEQLDLNIERSLIAGSTFVSPDKLEGMGTTQTQNAYMNFFEGSISRDPEKSLKWLNSRKYDEKLGVDNLKKLTFAAERRIKILNNERKKREKKTADFNRVLLAFEGKERLDPKDKDDQKLVNDFWDILSTQFEGMSKEEILNEAKVFSEAVGVLPEQIRRTTRALLINGNNSEKMLAADFVFDLTNDKPRLSEEFDATTKAVSRAIVDNRNAGIPVDRAVKWAEQRLDDNKKQTLENRQKEYYKNNSKLVKIDRRTLTQELNGFFGTIEIPDQILNDFEKIQEGYFTKEGSEREQAYELAKTDILNTWGVTKIGNKRYVKYPPELIYGKPIEEAYGIKPKKWIPEQITETIKEKRGLPKFETEKERKDFDERIILEVDPDSIITKRPIYNIFLRNDFGGVDLVLDNKNQPITYQPNFFESRIGKEIREKIKGLPEENFQQRLKDARQLREFQDKVKIIGRDIITPSPMGLFRLAKKGFSAGGEK